MASLPADVLEKKVSSASEESHRRLYALLFLIGCALRFGFVLWRKLYVPVPGAPRPFGMEVCSIAAHLARRQGFSSPFVQDTGPTAWVAPLYPFLVSLVFRLFGIYSAASAAVMLGIQCAMAAATGVCIHMLGRRTFGERIGYWAAWIWTLSPIFFRWPASWIWDFAASGLLLALTFLLTLDVAQTGSRRQWVLLGVLWGVTALTNPALLSLFPFTLAYAIFANQRANRRWAASAILSCALFAVIISPWLVRNDLVFGHPVFLRSNFWFEFHLGNYHYSNGMGFSGKHPGANPREFKNYADWGEQRYIAYYKSDALQFVREYPREFLSLTLHRAWWFWDGTPLLYQAGEWWQPWEFWPLSCLGWLGLLFVLTRRPTGWFLFAAALVVYPLPYYLTYSVSKYRYAIEPEMLLLAVYLVSVVWNELRRGKSLQKTQ
jgi:4-amino-4-deoxy-L-arabinose transferase-like glycosyltransferase